MTTAGTMPSRGGAAGLPRRRADLVLLPILLLAALLALLSTHYFAIGAAVG
jgi:hypothetical protein